MLGRGWADGPRVVERVGAVIRAVGPARARRDHEQATRATARQATADAKERKQLYAEARKAEAASMASELRDRIAELDSVLTAGIRQHPLVTFASLKHAPSHPPFDAGGLDRPQPASDWKQFAPPPPSGLGKLLGGAARYQREEAAARAAFEAELDRHASAEAERRRRLAERRAAYDQAGSRRHPRTTELTRWPSTKIPLWAGTASSRPSAIAARWASSRCALWPGSWTTSTPRRGILVTTSWVTKDGHDFAQRHGRIRLIECEEIKYLCKEHLGLDVLISLPKPPPKRR